MALIAASTFIPGVADAGGYRRWGGTVTTPFGSANMNSPEWRQSGGDFRVYQQIMQQKQMMLQQQAMMKQQQAFLRQQKKAGNAQPSNSVAARPAPATKVRKKRPTRKVHPTSVAAQKVQKSSKTTKP
jgi:hypothetical protein